MTRTLGVRTTLDVRVPVEQVGHLGRHPHGHVGLSGLHHQHARTVLGYDTKHDFVDFGRFAPIVVVASQRNLVARRPIL